MSWSTLSELPLPNGIKVAFIGQEAGLLSNSRASAMSLNRQILENQLSSREICLLQQVHSNRVVRANPRFCEEADAHWTDKPNRSLVILAADCVPLFLFDRSQRIVAAAHCGWKGVAKGVIENLIHALPVVSRELQAFIGPAICGKCYEVGEELLPQLNLTRDSTLITPIPNSNEKYLLDLPRLIEYRVSQFGIEHIERTRECTFHNARKYASYRRNKTEKRQACVIKLTGAEATVS